MMTRIEMKDYLVLPKQTEGYFDTVSAPYTNECSLLTITEFMMAQFCIQVNRVFLIAAYKWSKKESKLARNHFFHIFNNYGISIDTCFNHLAFDCDFNQKLAVDRNLILEGIPFMESSREMAIECRRATLDALREWATKELDRTISYESPFYSYDDICTCRILYSSYVDFALDKLNACWFDEVATFIAYPFQCEEYFDHIVAAENNQNVHEIDYDYFPSDFDPDEDGYFIESTSPITSLAIYSAIHLPDSTKQILYVSEGIIHKIQTFSPTDSVFPTILTEDIDDSLIFTSPEEEPSNNHLFSFMESLDILTDYFAATEVDFDLSDMDLYLDSDEIEFDLSDMDLYLDSDEIEFDLSDMDLYLDSDEIEFDLSDMDLYLDSDEIEFDLSDMDLYLDSDEIEFDLSDMDLYLDSDEVDLDLSDLDLLEQTKDLLQI